MDFEFYFLVVALIKIIKKRRKCRMRRWGVRPINRNRDKIGFFKVIFLNMKENDPEQFFKYCRMSAETFDVLLSLVKDKLKRTSKKAIIPEMKLAITLVYLSQGDSVQSVAWCYHLGKTTVRQIALDTCIAIYGALNITYLSPVSTQEWQKIAEEFNSKWNLSNCIGAIDGKHIAIRLPPNSGSEYYNYKNFYSVVLMAVCDANYNFTMVDVGFTGSESDGGIFRRSIFGQAVIGKTLNIPEWQPLSSTNVQFPHYIIGDAAFPLMENLIRPYPGRFLAKDKLIFNYRLSRARRTIENAFGILVARWRILLTTLNVRPKNVTHIVLATVCLHNFIKTEETTRPLAQYCPINFADTVSANGDVSNGQWREEIQPLMSVHRMAQNRSVNMAYKLRDELKDYVNGVGSLHWQANLFQHNN